MAKVYCQMYKHLLYGNLNYIKRNFYWNLYVMNLNIFIISHL